MAGKSGGRTSTTGATPGLGTSIRATRVATQRTKVSADAEEHGRGLPPRDLVDRQAGPELEAQPVEQAVAKRRQFGGEVGQREVGCVDDRQVVVTGREPRRRLEQFVDLGVAQRPAPARRIIAELAAHPFHHAVQVGAGLYVGQEGFVLLLHGGPVYAVHARIVEIITIHTPCFIEYVTPFFSGVNFDFNGASIQHVFS